MVVVTLMMLVMVESTAVVKVVVVVVTDNGDDDRESARGDRWVSTGTHTHTLGSRRGEGFDTSHYYHNNARTEGWTERVKSPPSNSYTHEERQREKRGILTMCFSIALICVSS